MPTRRGFIAAMIAASATPRLAWADLGSPSHLAAAKTTTGPQAGGFVLAGIGPEGGERFRIDMPARGHAGAGHPVRAEAVAFARRPGAFALVIDCGTGAVLHRLTPPSGRQFNGHGVYLHDGAVLATSEQMAAGSAGLVGLWDVEARYRRIGEFSTHGIGPHELRLMAEEGLIVVANGGIETDGEDRTQLNIPVMRPNLTYLTLEGALADQVELAPDLHFNSIRHLALGGGGQVAFAMQWHGDETALPPLMGLHRRGQAPVLAEVPVGEALTMRNYASSIAFAGDGGQVAITSSKGGRLQRFSPEGGFLGSLVREDVSGLAPLGAGLIASDGYGGLIALEGGVARGLSRSDLAFDNHLVAL